MPTYIFFRDRHFYPIDLRDDADAVENAARNPGTEAVAKIEPGFGIRTIWEAKQQH